jgi:hypothetical protein
MVDGEAGLVGLDPRMGWNLECWNLSLHQRNIYSFRYC